MPVGTTPHEGTMPRGGTSTVIQSRPRSLWESVTRTFRVASLAASIPGVAFSQTPWTVDSRPVLDRTGIAEDGSLMFEHALSALRLSDGRIVVADGGAGVLRFFNATGGLTRTVGRRGQGPGEFSYIAWIGQCARDSVFAWDPVQRQMSVVSSSGTVARRFRFAPGADPRGVTFSLSCARDGAIAVHGHPATLRPATRDEHVLRGMGALVIVDGDGKVIQRFPETASGEWIALRPGTAPRPLGKATTIALTNARLYVGTADSAAVEVYARDGRRLPVLRFPSDARASTRESYEGAVEATVAMAAAPVRRAWRERLLAMAPPKQEPPYTAIRADSEGVLWVIEHGSGRRGTRMRALSEAGRTLADLRLPVALTVFEIGRDYVLGSYEGEDGEPHLAMYRLRR